MFIMSLEIQIVLNSSLYRFAGHVLSLGSCLSVSGKAGYQVRRQNRMDKGMSRAYMLLCDSVCLNVSLFVFTPVFLWPVLPLGHSENSPYQTRAEMRASPFQWSVCGSGRGIESHEWKIIIFLFFVVNPCLRIFFSLISREWERLRGERRRETHQLAASHTRPGLGIEPGTLRCSGRYSSHWTTPARAIFLYLKCNRFV